MTGINDAALGILCRQEVDFGEKQIGVKTGETCQMSEISSSSAVVFFTFFSRQFAWMAAMGRESRACLHQQSFAACLELRKSLHRSRKPFCKAATQAA